MDQENKPVENLNAEAHAQESVIEEPVNQAATPSVVESQSSGKADLGKRAIAYIIDAVAVAVVSAIPFGGILGAAYILGRDGFDFEFMDGRSLGKKLMKLRPVRADGGKMDLTTSAMRNWPLALGALISIPVLGWIAAIVLIPASIILGILELILVLTDDEGRRWGDRLAGTKVVEVDA